MQSLAHGIPAQPCSSGTLLNSLPISLSQWEEGRDKGTQSAQGLTFGQKKPSRWELSLAGGPSWGHFYSRMLGLHPPVWGPAKWLQAQKGPSPPRQRQVCVATVGGHLDKVPTRAYTLLPLDLDLHPGHAAACLPPTCTGPAHR